MKKKTPAILYERLKAARMVLGLCEEVTLDKIKEAFRNRIRQCHPDKAHDKTQINHEKSQKIIEAYKVIMDYCKEYRISFSRETVNRYRSEEEIWFEKFGNDPMWGGGV